MQDQARAMHTGSPPIHHFMPRKRKPVTFPIIVFGHNSTAPGGNFGAEIEPKPAHRDLGIYDSVEQRERFEGKPEPTKPALIAVLEMRAKRNDGKNGLRSSYRKLKNQLKEQL